MRNLQILQDVSCAVVGSAPGVTVPLGVDRLLGVNGGASVPGVSLDVLFTTCYLFGFEKRHVSRVEVTEHRLATAVLERMKGVQTNVLVADTRRGSLLNVVDGCRKWGIAYNTILGVNPSELDAIVYEASELHLGKAPNRVSSGMFAVCAALVFGAERVILCGISLKGGHHAMKDKLPRHHTRADEQCLKALCYLHGPRLSTTSAELVKRFGMVKV